jgi:hypothetical protein
VRVIASSKVNSYSITTKLIVKISGKKKEYIINLKAEKYILTIGTLKI